MKKIINIAIITLLATVIKWGMLTNIVMLVWFSVVGHQGLKLIFK